jgi:hypothetical protein
MVEVFKILYRGNNSAHIEIDPIVKQQFQLKSLFSIIFGVVPMAIASGLA